MNFLMTIPDYVCDTLLFTLTESCKYLSFHTFKKELA